MTGECILSVKVKEGRVWLGDWSGGLPWGRGRSDGLGCLDGGLFALKQGFPK